MGFRCLCFLLVFNLIESEWERWVEAEANYTVHTTQPYVHLHQPSLRQIQQIWVKVMWHVVVVVERTRPSERFSLHSSSGFGGFSFKRNARKREGRQNEGGWGGKYRASENERHREIETIHLINPPEHILNPMKIACFTITKSKPITQHFHWNNIVFLLLQFRTKQRNKAS